MYRSNRCRLARDLAAFPEAAGENLSMRIEPDGQPVAQPNARVLQRKITSALVKRRSLQTADHLVTDPTVDGGANSRS